MIDFMLIKSSLAVFLLMLLFYYISNSVSMNVVFFHRSLKIIVHKGNFIPVLRGYVYFKCVIQGFNLEFETPFQLTSRTTFFNTSLLKENLFYRDSSASSIRGGSSYTRRKWEEDVKKNSLNEGPTSLNTSYQRRCGIFSYLTFFLSK